MEKREIFAHPSFPLRFLIHFIGDCALQVENGCATIQKETSHVNNNKQKQKSF